MKHDPILDRQSAAGPLLRADIRFEAEVTRVEEGAMMRLFTIRAIAIDPHGRRAEVGRLHAWQGLYRGLGPQLIDPDCPLEVACAEFDEISYDAGMAVEAFLDGRAALEPRLAGEIAQEQPSGIVYIEQVFTHPGARGARLALRLLAELRALLAGSASLVLLKAIPIETPYDGPGDDFRRGALASDAAGREALVRYYRSDAELDLRPPHGTAKPNLLAAVWPAFAEAPLFDLALGLPSSLWARMED